MFRIEKRKYVRWGEYLTIPFIPTLTYGMGKFVGVKYNNLEFIWWVLIPFLWILYLFLHIRIVKKSNFYG